LFVESKLNWIVLASASLYFFEIFILSTFWFLFTPVYIENIEKKCKEEKRDTIQSELSKKKKANVRDFILKNFY
jgi:hypothetical protein